MPAKPHRISRQVLELQLSGPADPFALQHRFVKACQAYAEQEMSHLFDRFGSPERVFYLERLEVDLGQVP